MPTEKLAWGYNPGLPTDVGTAWGCRAIADRDGTVDLVHDRTDEFGPNTKQLRAALIEHLPNAIDEARRLLLAGVMRPNTAAEFTLHEDSALVVKANTLGSYGYLYLCAYLVEG